MRPNLTAVLLLITAPALAAAQQRPLSPPERAPVPLSDTDQQRARAEELARNTGGATPPASVAPPVKAPVIHSGDAAIDKLVWEASLVFGLDPMLVYSVIKAESGFNRLAVSPKGACGLMQLMPATSARFGVKNVFDPRENVFAGARYLRWLLDRFGGEVRLALAAYNAGEGAVDRYDNRIPPFLETQDYVRAIYGEYLRLRSGAATGSARQQPLKETIPSFNQIIKYAAPVAGAVQAGSERPD